MNKTKTTNNITLSDRISVNTETLANYLDCGRSTAVKIGTDANAKIIIGKRVLWNINKIKEYLDSISC